MEAALGNLAVPNAYLCSSTLNNVAAARIYLLHMPSKYSPALDGSTTLWDSRLFCFLRNVIQDTATTVGPPNTAFDLTPATWVYSNDTMPQHLPSPPTT
jgi:hypothetical protein